MDVIAEELTWLFLPSPQQERNSKHTPISKLRRSSFLASSSSLESCSISLERWVPNSFSFACLWQGVLMLQDKYRAIMQYCIPREGMGDRGSSSANQDWYCVKCVAHNFKRRDTCFRCQASRQESEHGGEGSDEVSPHPTHTVLLRRLDVLSTEDSVLGALQTFSSRPIRSIRIGRDSLTNTSRGVCYVEMNSVTDAMYLHNALAANPPVIDGKKVFVSYCKLPQVSSSSSSAVAASTALAAAQWSHQGTGTAAAASSSVAGAESQVTEYGPDDVPRLAEYSATLYAKTTEEHAAYLQYYQTYYASKIAEGGTIVLPTQTTAVSNSAAAAAQSAILQAQAAKEFNKQPSKVDSDSISGVTTSSAAVASGNGALTASGTVPYITAQAQGQEYPKYPVPDVSTYQYDKSSGYYYDPQTGLYYDASSQYYYNAHAQQFLYWDHIRQTYLPAPAGADEQMQRSQEEHQAGGKDGDGKGKGKDKPDKVKVAKKIAKDMERWAKTLNQRKENARQAQAALASASMPRSSGAADAGYAVLERRDRGGEESGRSAPPAAPLLQFLQRQRDGGSGGAEDDRVVSSPLSMSAQLGGKGGLVAAYGEGSEGEEDGDEGGVGGVDDRHTDWTKLACLLCKRQFPSKEALIRHQQLSDLHKQNLRLFQGGGGGNDGALNYRDRAKERRLKFGEPDQPHPNSLKEKYLKAREEAAATSYEEPTKEGIGSDNVGNKLLQKMGWQEGMGLGKSNQGRTKIVEAEGRGSTAGLGLKGSTFTVRPGETYKDSVKKLMFARYKEVADEEK